MKRKLKEQLRQYYQVREPKGKDAFLAGLQTGRRRMTALLLVQMQYIPKTAWVLSSALFVLMLAAERVLQAHHMGCVYALVPFLGAATVSVSMGSLRCRMAELESTTLFSFGSVFMMRMLILGAGNFAALVIVAAFGGALYFLTEFMYLLVPYMLTAAGSLMVYRRAAQRDAVCMSLAVSLAVAALELAAVGSPLYQTRYTLAWAAACVLLFVFLAVQVRKSTQIMEEMVWN